MTTTTVSAPVAPPRGIRGSRRASRNASFLVGITLTVLFLLVAAASLVWTPFDPNGVAPADRLLGPGADGHLLGTDHLGRDIVSQLMVGARTSVVVAAIGTVLGLVVGALGGLAAASRRGLADEGIMRFADILLAFPGIVFALVLAATVGSGARSTVLALMVFFAPSFARVIRAAALRVLEEDFVTAARIYGRGWVFILARHVLPNISSVLIVQFTLYFAVGILVEAALSYLGAGINRPGVSFGMMLQEAQANVGASGLLALWPGIAIVLAALGLNLLGDGLRDILDPKLSRSR